MGLHGFDYKNIYTPKKIGHKKMAWEVLLTWIFFLLFFLHNFQEKNIQFFLAKTKKKKSEHSLAI